MKFKSDKKNDVILYLLEKIQKGDEAVSKTVSETFGINQNTVHRYINELVEDGIIKRVKRGVYELVYTTESHTFKNTHSDLPSDSYPYEKFFKKYISDFSQNVHDMWSYVMSEMVNNVMDHSESETLNMIVFQDYLKTTVIIDDNGVGIFKKIKEHFDMPSIDDAICELFKGKLTTNETCHSGEGIFFSSRIMDTFEIYSDSKHFSINRLNDWELHDWQSAIDKKGTTLIMSLSNRSTKKLVDIFNAYSNVDGGFKKTVIPLRYIFESSPISRSQAKRVCARLQNFSKVEIDFEGIEWVGQAFMHEIFSVFCKSHEGIELVPTNMNKTCQDMYSHVIS